MTPKHQPRDLETGPRIPADAQERPKEEKDATARPAPRERIHIKIAADHDRPMPRPETVDPIPLKQTLTYYPHRRGHSMRPVEDLPREVPCAVETPRDPSQVLGFQARVVDMEGDRAVLEDGRMPALAVGCVVRPQAGDTVLVSHDPFLVVAVLERPGGGGAKLNVPGAVSVKIQQQRVAVEAVDDLALRSLRDVEVTAAGGLSLTARNLFTHVLDTLVERAANRIAKVGSYALDVTGLWRMRTRHAVVKADKQLCMDAEQIHLG